VGINASDARTVSFNLPVLTNKEIDEYTDLGDDLNSLGVVKTLVSGNRSFEITIQKKWWVCIYY